MTLTDLLTVTATVTETKTLPNAELANMLGVSIPTIVRWRKEGIPIMPTIILTALREGKITRSDIIKWTD